MEDKLKKVRLLLLIFIAILFLSFHYYSVYFINSAYLRSIFSEGSIGYIFTLGTLLNIGMFIVAPTIMRIKGNFKLTMWLVLFELFALLGMAFATNALSLILCFLVQQMISPVLFYCLDIFLEAYTAPNEVGSVRGISLTMVNTPSIITPFIVGLLLVQPTYWKVYLIAAIFLIPFVLIMFTYFRKFPDPVYPILETKVVAKTFFEDKKVFDVFLDHFILNFFYGWMVIYMPIYLHDHIGFSWPQIGAMFSIMLLPFVLFQIPIGRAADRYHDEKSVLIVGFIIMGVATMLIPFLTEPNIVIWTALLFVTRIGASLVEVASDSYFFKHIHPENTGFIGIYRMTRALPFLFIPPLVSLCLYLFDFKYMFIVLGAIMLVGIRYSLPLKE
jgi:MFS family permease